MGTEWTEAALRDLLDETIRSVAGFPVDLDAGFFEAGLTSALLLRVHRDLEAVLGGDIPVLLLFQHPTRRVLARRLAARAHGAAVGAAATSPAGRTGPTPVPDGARTAAAARRALRSQIRGTGR
jgi:hypothetical protein